MATKSNIVRMQPAAKQRLDAYCDRNFAIRSRVVGAAVDEYIKRRDHATQQHIDS